MAHENSGNVMVDSKDAIQSDVCPVQKPGKTWKKIELPDHDWQRTTQTTVTPMTHLFIKTFSNLEENNVISITRSDMSATTLNVTFFEPHTVQRVFNELFLLLLKPSLDSVFRNPLTGRLKEHFVFVVDNGPAEAPSSPMVAIWLVRLARILQLKSVTQKSFAEYHSKRNPVERVHAVHNSALSNEVFPSHGLHKNHEIGDTRHYENMEFIAEKVMNCLKTTRFGGHACTILRGIGKDEVIPFNYDKVLISFLQKSEQKKDKDDLTYSPVEDSLWTEVARVFIHVQYCD